MSKTKRKAAKAAQSAALRQPSVAHGAPDKPLSPLSPLESEDNNGGRRSRTSHSAQDVADPSGQHKNQQHSKVGDPPIGPPSVVTNSVNSSRSANARRVSDENQGTPTFFNWMHPSEMLGSNNRRVNSIEREFTFARERNSLSLLQEQVAELATLLDNTQREIGECESQNSRHKMSDNNI